MSLTTQSQQLSGLFSTTTTEQTETTTNLRLQTKIVLPEDELNMDTSSVCAIIAPALFSKRLNTMNVRFKNGNEPEKRVTVNDVRVFVQGKGWAARLVWAIGGLPYSAYKAVLEQNMYDKRTESGTVSWTTRLFPKFVPVQLFNDTDPKGRENGFVTGSDSTHPFVTPLFTAPSRNWKLLAPLKGKNGTTVEEKLKWELGEYTLIGENLSAYSNYGGVNGHAGFSGDTPGLWCVLFLDKVIDNAESPSVVLSATMKAPIDT